MLKVARRLHDPVLLHRDAQPARRADRLSSGSCSRGWELAPRLGSEFLPELNEGSIYCTFTLPPTSSLARWPQARAEDRGDAAGRSVAGHRSESFVKPVPEVTEILVQLGRPEDGTDAKLFNNFEVFIKLKPMKEWRRWHQDARRHRRDPDLKILKAIPGIESELQPADPRQRQREHLAVSRARSRSRSTARMSTCCASLAEQVENEVGKVPGIVDVGIVKAAEQPVIAVTIPDRNALARWDQDLGSFQDFVETALSGHAASELRDGEKKFDVTVRFPRAAREDLSTIRELRVPLKDGSLVPVAALAKVEMSAGPAAITRDNGKRYIGVRTNIRNRDLGSAIAEAQQRVEKNVKFPTGYDVTWGGEFENQQRAMKRLALDPAADASSSHSCCCSPRSDRCGMRRLIIMVNLPIALLGGLVGLGAATHDVVGICSSRLHRAPRPSGPQWCARSQCDSSAPRYRGDDLWTATVEGTRERLRAILMTALLASLGLLPAAMSHAIGSETQRPIAMVVVSGTISAALLTLVVLPVSYYWAGAARAWVQRRRTGQP